MVVRKKKKTRLEAIRAKSPAFSLPLLLACLIVGLDAMGLLLNMGFQHRCMRPPTGVINGDPRRRGLNWPSAFRTAITWPDEKFAVEHNHKDGEELRVTTRAFSTVDGHISGLWWKARSENKTTTLQESCFRVSSLQLVFCSATACQC